MTNSSDGPAATSTIEAVVAIVHNADRFLVVRRTAANDHAVGYWCPVSGRIEPGESQADAVAREVMEEVGLEVTAVRKVHELPIPEGRFLLHYWTTLVRGGVARVASPEIDAIRWVTLDQFRDLTPNFEDDTAVFERMAANPEQRSERKPACPSAPPSNI